MKIYPKSIEAYYNIDYEKFKYLLVRDKFKGVERILLWEVKGKIFNNGDENPSMKMKILSIYPYEASFEKEKNKWENIDLFDDNIPFNDILFDNLKEANDYILKHYFHLVII